MPTFQIGLDDGRSLRIEADDQDAALRGVQHFMDSEKPSGVAAGLKQGLADEVQGLGETGKQFLGLGNQTTDQQAAKIAPKDYHAAHIVPEGGHWYDPRTYNYSQIPQALAEAAPGITTDLAAGLTAGKTLGPRAGLVAGIGSMLARTLGRSAKEDASIRTGNPGAEPELQDKARAAATGVVSAIPQAIGLSRFLPGFGTAGKSTLSALGRAATTTGTEGAAAGAMDAINQVGSTVGTDKGVQYDPARGVSSAITGAAGGGLLAAPRAASALSRARILREFGDESQQASEAVANRIATAAEGNRIGTNAEPVHVATGDIKSELSNAVRAVRARSKLDEASTSALNRAVNGRKLTDTDLSNIRDAVSSDPAGEQVMQLVRQARVMAKLKEQGTLTNEKFVGGVSSLPTVKQVLSRPIAAVAGPAIGYGLGASQGLGWLMAHPGTIAGLGAGYLGLRGIDAITGSRAPAQRFVDQFANTTTPVRPVVSTRPPEPISDRTQGPWGQRLPGPSVPQVQPLAAPEPMEPTLRQTLRANASIEEGMGKIVRNLANAKRKAFVSDAQPLLRELAAQRNTTAAQDQLRDQQVAPEIPSPPLAPVFTRLNKKLNGKLTIEQPQAGSYSPIPEEKLWRKSLTDDQVATQELASYRPAVQAKYHGNVANTRRAKFDLLHGFADERIDSNTADARIAGLLYHQLDHISRRSLALQAIEHYAAMMTPEGATELRALFTPAKMSDLWAKE